METVRGVAEGEIIAYGSRGEIALGEGALIRFTSDNVLTNV